MGEALPWKARWWLPAAVGLLLCGVVESVAPRVLLQMPRGGGTVSLAIGHLVLAPLAVALVGAIDRTWCSPCRTRREDGWERRAFVLLVAVACLVITSTGAWRLGWEGGWVLGRAVLAWVALALMSWRFFGARRVWVLPMVVLLVVVLLLGESVSTITWMSDDLRSGWPWLTACATWVLAGVASWVTPWRLFLLRTRMRAARPWACENLRSAGTHK